MKIQNTLKWLSVKKCAGADSQVKNKFVDKISDVVSSQFEISYYCFLQLL